MHELVLSPSKIEIGITKIYFIGFIIAKGKIELQEHVLQKLTSFLAVFIDKIQLQCFLGSLNYYKLVELRC